MSDADPIDPVKLKVVELRSELSVRGLDTKGNKAILVRRLKSALAKEAGAVGDVDELNEDELNDVTGDFDTSCESQNNESRIDLDAKADEDENDDEMKDDENDDEMKDEPEEKVNPPEKIQQVEEDPVDLKDEVENGVGGNTQDVKVEENVETKDVDLNVETKDVDLNVETKDVDLNVETKDVDLNAAKTEEGAEIKKESDENEHGDEVKQENGENTVEMKKEVEEKPNGDDGNRGKKRRHDHSHSGNDQKRRYEERKAKFEPPVLEDTVEFDDTLVVLDLYMSDLNLKLEPTRCSATPLHNDGFAYVWAGARASYGFKEGKICYELKITKHEDVSHLPSDEVNPHVVRIGYSVASPSLQLGEDPLSYGFGGTGKFSTDCKFSDYGKTFKEDDVVQCFINMDVDPIELSFSVNGEHCGSACTITKEDLGDKPLYPHVLTKNCTFEVNFGQKEEPYFPLPEGYTDYVFPQSVDLEKRIRGAVCPATKEECEMIMMCGIPGAGKTYWAIEQSKQNPEKYYNILGTNTIIDKMKVMGLPRKRNYHGRWDVLIDKSTGCLNKLLGIAACRRRNYILDQTNVYPSAQRRKMRPFEGFQRKAVVVIPTDDEFKGRIEKRTKDEGKDVPDSAVLEMKANYVLPEVGDCFSEVTFSELQEEEAKKLVEQYRKEGKAAAPKKKFRDRHSKNRKNQRSGRTERNYRSSGGGRNWNHGGGGGGGNRNWGYGGGGGSGGGGYRNWGDGSSPRSYGNRNMGYGMQSNRQGWGDGGGRSYGSGNRSMGYGMQGNQGWNYGGGSGGGGGYGGNNQMRSGGGGGGGSGGGGSRIWSGRNNQPSLLGNRYRGNQGGGGGGGSLMQPFKQSSPYQQGGYGGPSMHGYQQHSQQQNYNQWDQYYQQYYPRNQGGGGGNY